MEFKDYYQVMGVARDATQDEIKRAYRRLARKYHPDVSKEPHAEQRFKEVGEAYEVLKDAEKRAAYDRLGEHWKEGQDFRPPPDWDAGFEFSGGGAEPHSTRDFSDFFETLFGRSFHTAQDGRHGLHARGGDHHAKILIDLADAYHGAVRTLTLQAPTLDSQGRVITRERQLNVRIPQGIRQGQEVRLPGQGAPGLGQGAAGDLYLEIEFHPHPHFRVDGRDVYLEFPLAPWEAALGATVKAPTPAGTVELNIPKGSVSGRRLRLKGRGIPGTPAGDLYVVLTIALPPATSPQAQALYREMATAMAFNPRADLGV